LILSAFDALAEWDAPSIEAAVRGVVDISGAKLRDAVRPLYIAVTGSPQSVPLFESMVLLGRDLVRERLRVALETLGGATKAETEAWRKLLTVASSDENGSAA
jgi:glutamyl-tRNA synthetase